MCKQTNRPRQWFRSSQGGGLVKPHLYKPVNSCCNWEKWIGVVEGTNMQKGKIMSQQKEWWIKPGGETLPTGLTLKGWCFTGTCRLLGVAPAPSHPSKSPIKKEQSCSSLSGALAGKGGWEEKKYLVRSKSAKGRLREANRSPAADVMLQERC